MTVGEKQDPRFRGVVGGAQQGQLIERMRIECEIGGLDAIKRVAQQLGVIGQVRAVVDVTCDGGDGG